MTILPLEPSNLELIPNPAQFPAPGFVDYYIERLLESHGPVSEGYAATFRPPPGEYDVVAWQVWASRRLTESLLLEAPEVFAELLAELEPIRLASDDRPKKSEDALCVFNEWAERWHLDGGSGLIRDLFLETLALETVYLMTLKTHPGTWNAVDEAIARHRSYFERGFFDPDPKVGEWTITFPAFDAQRMSESSFLQQLRERATRQGRDHIARQNAQLQETGQQRRPRHRDDDALAHMRWYVRYQVLEESHQTISTRSSHHQRSKEAVRAGIRTLVDRTNLGLRDGKKGGRPPRAKQFSS